MIYGQNFIFATAVGFIFGIAVRSLSYFGIALAALFLFFGILTFVFAYANPRVRFSSLIIAFVFFGVGLGIIRTNIFFPSQKDFPPHLETKINSYITIDGVVIKDLDTRENGTNITLLSCESASKSDCARVLVRAPLHTQIQYGDIIRATGTLVAPEKFDTSEGRFFDYPSYLMVDKIYYILERANVEKIDVGEKSEIFAWLYRQKRAFLSGISHSLPNPESDLAAGITIGEKRGLQKDMQSTFIETGLMHIVVLSGYNISILTNAVGRATLFFGANSIFSALLSSLLAFIVVALSGFESAGLRAGTMAVIAGSATILDKKYSALRALFFTSVFMVAMNPLILVFDIGFQMSVMATLGIILVPMLIRFENESEFKTLATSTIGAQIAVLPLILYYTGNLSLVAPIANMLALPLVPFTMFFSILSGFVGMFFETIAPLVGSLAWIFLFLIENIAEILASAPFASILIPKFPFLWVAFSYVILAILIWEKVRGMTKNDVK